MFSSLLRTALSLLVLSSLLPIPAAANTYWQRHSQGWHWYHDSKLKPEAATTATTPQPIDPIAQMEALQINVKRALNLAILNPTPLHVTAYLRLQNQVAMQASRFSQVWQEVLRNNPQFDYSLIHPTSQLGQEAYMDHQHLQLDKKVKALSSQVGLFFIFKGACPYCQHFAPIVQRFTKRYGFYLLPISLDNEPLPEYPFPKADNGIAGRLHITQVPALVAVRFDKSMIKPITFGLISEQELLERVAALTPSSSLH